jgi:hypothetical protein
MAIWNKEDNQYSFNIKGLERLAFDNPRYERVVVRSTDKIATMLRDRIDREGKDHHGQPLPKVQPRAGWCWFSRADPRFTRVAKLRQIVPYKGAVKSSVYVRGYRRLKQKMNKHGNMHRGASLTGAMWDNLEVRVKRGRKGTGSVQFRLYFAKSQRVGIDPKLKTKTGRAKKVSVRNRTKAKMLQFKHRNENGQPVGRQFVLMQPSNAEISLLRNTVASGFKFARR